MAEELRSVLIEAAKEHDDQRDHNYTEAVGSHGPREFQIVRGLDPHSEDWKGEQTENCEASFENDTCGREHPLQQ